MNTITAAFSGAGIAILLAALFYGAYKGCRFLLEMMRLLASIAKVLSGVHSELTYMRQLSEAQYAETGYRRPGSSEPPAAPAPAGGPLPMYPAPVMDRFQVVTEDATAADNHIDIIKQTDEQLADAERKEQLRERGVVVEDDEEVHPGVQVDT